MPVSIVNMTTYDGGAGGHPAGITFPSTTSGNTLVVLEADYGQGGGNIGFQPFLGGVGLTESPADSFFIPTGANIWYLENIPGGHTSLDYPVVSPGAVVVYELTPCTYDQSANDQGANPTSVTEVATAISGSGGDAYFVVIGQGQPGDAITGSYAVSSPWTLDFSQSGLFYGFLGNFVHGMGGFAHILNGGTSEQATFTVTNPQTPSYGTSAISFTPTSECQLSVTPPSLNFSAAVGGSNPPAQNVTATNTGAGGSVSISYLSNQSWLFPASGSGNTPDTISVSVNISGLAAGTYTGGLTFTSTCGSPPVTVNVTLVVAPTTQACAPISSAGVPVNGVFIPDLSLFVIPSAALYTQPVPNAAITVNEDTSQGRRQIILDFNNNEGLYVRDLGTIFTWPINVPTILDVWQPSIIPMDDDVYNRMSFHFLMSSGGMVGWGHLREVNLAFQSTQDLTLLLTFDQWLPITLNIPNSGGNEVKMKVVIPPNKFKLIEGFLSCPTSFKLWASDVVFKIGQWGRSGAYAVTKPLVG